MKRFFFENWQERRQNTHYVSYMYVQKDKMEEFPRTFYLVGYILCCMFLYELTGEGQNRLGDHYGTAYRPM